MINLYGEDVPSYFTIKFPNYFDVVGNQFKTIQDAKNLLKQEPTTNIKKVEVLILADRRIRVSIIADADAVLKMVHEDLGLSKVSAR
jgi:hypothetical protein